MKIERLVISFNNFDFVDGGVPPKSYGARIELRGESGTLITPLFVDTVEAILNMVAPEVAEYVQRMSAVVNKTSLINRGDLVPHAHMLPHAHDDGLPF